MNDRTDIHDIHIDKDREHAVREPKLRFAEVELGVPEGRETEPIRKVVAPEGWDRELDWRENFRYISREQQFVQKGRELEQQSVDYAEFVPFQTYWPTYDQMQPLQLRWYLYWRGEVRSERYPDTDLSYLFVYLYELIHGIGWSAPPEGYELMNRVWRAYRQRYPKLDGYVREWLFDFALVFGLEMPSPEPIPKLPRNLSYELKELEWKRRFAAEPLSLSWEMILPLIDYEVEKSRFYAGEGRAELRNYVPKTVALVDGYLAKSAGTKLIDRFKAKEQTVTRYLFRSAVYDHELYGRTRTVNVRPVSDNPPLRAYLTQLVRFTENKLRELKGFKGKLRGIEIEPEVERLISRFLRREFEHRKAEEAKSRAPKVKINAAKLRKLRQESDEVRDMLLIEELPSANGEPVSLQTSVSAKPSVSQTKRDRKLPIPGEPLQAELDFERGWQVFEDEQAADEKIYEQTTEQIYEKTNERPPETMKLENAGIPGGLPGDARHAESGNPDTTEELSPEWRELSARLSSAHKQMLSAILNEADAFLRNGIAEQAGSMPELLLDEINELSMETIGDLLIDGDEIAEEYRAELAVIL
ncbi:TerB N-terminal domain-containing protein [Paenibacillus sp. M1]|uniref:TerB N-terminal domain-containing protein n=1 Tax=Paenibacillus haidiansis TaxID=1574488 RepID=A0ABU7VPD9_9BACL